MGCFQSRDKPVSIGKFHSEFIETKVPDLDKFFNDAKTFIAQAEEYRSGIEDAPENLKAQVEGWRLEEYGIGDALKVWLWSLARNGGGKLSGVKFEMIAEVPFFKYDCPTIDEETKKFTETLSKYLADATNGHKKLPEISKNLGDLLSKAGDVKVIDSCKGVGLDEEAIKAVAKSFSENIVSLTKTTTDMTKLITAAGTAAADSVKIVTQIRTYSLLNDDIGTKALNDKVTSLPEILKKYHSGPFKTQEQLDKEKAEAAAAAAASTINLAKPSEVKAEKPAEKQAEKPAEKQAEKPAEKAAEKSPEKPAPKAEEKKAEEKPVENAPEAKAEVKPEIKVDDVKTEESETTADGGATPVEEGSNKKGKKGKKKN